MVQRRLCVLLASGAAAYGVWKSVPGTPVDRAAFTAVAGGFVNGPLFVSGGGSHPKPWQLRAFSTEAKPDKRQAPVIVSLGDDLEGFFQASPPAPIDMAVIFTNFQRLGAKKAATSAVLSWETPDPIGLTAFERSLAGFDSLVMAAPLSRGPVPSPMPPSFRRASLPLEAVRGDISVLPVVNRIPISGVILGGDNTVTGFSFLESETSGEGIPLFARWEDRVVLSFPLLTVLQRLNLPPEQLEIRLGQYLKLGSDGPVVPIDTFGRFRLPARKVAAYVEISAEALIDGGDDLFPKQAPDPVILRDDRSAAEPATRAFSRDLSAIIANLATEDSLSVTRSFPRLPEEVEVYLLGAMTLALAVFFGIPHFSRHILAMAFIGACLAAQWIGLGLAALWLPGVPLLAAVLAAYLVTLLMGLRSEVPAAEIASNPAGVILPAPVHPLSAEPAALEPVSLPEAPTTPEPALEEDPETVAPAAPAKPPRKRATKAAAQAPTKKAVPKKESARKEPARKEPARKEPAKKAPAKKAEPKKTAAPKPPSKPSRSKRPPEAPPA